MPAITLPDYTYNPQLGWSSTRSETFRSCRRRYFFQYYGRYDNECQPGQIQRLKGLSSIAMTVGKAVHAVLADLLKRLLRTVEPIDQELLKPHVETTIAKFARCHLRRRAPI